MIDTAPADSFLFIFLSMIIIAISLYLPEHITRLFTRAWFYYAGDENAAAQRALGEGAGGTVGPKLGRDSTSNAGLRIPGQDVISMLGEL